METLMQVSGARGQQGSGQSGVTVSVFGQDDEQVAAGRTVYETLHALGALPKPYEEVHLNDRRVTNMDHTTTQAGDTLFVSPHPQGGGRLPAWLTMS